MDLPSLRLVSACIMCSMTSGGRSGCVRCALFRAVALLHGDAAVQAPLVVYDPICCGKAAGWRRHGIAASGSWYIEWKSQRGPACSQELHELRTSNKEEAYLPRSCFMCLCSLLRHGDLWTVFGLIRLPVIQLHIGQLLGD